MAQRISIGYILVVLHKIKDMKKLLLSFIIALFSIVGFAQTRAPKGITIGDHRVPGSNIQTIDSTTFDGTYYVAYKNGDTVDYYTKISERMQLAAAWIYINTPRSTGNVVAVTGITLTMLSPQMYYNGSSAIDISANPQIVDGTNGQIITITGSSDTNTLTLDDGTGLALTAQCVLGIRDSITLMYNSTLDIWIQQSVNNNN
jgi:hypothetical protein